MPSCFSLFAFFWFFPVFLGAIRVSDGEDPLKEHNLIEPLTLLRNNEVEAFIKKNSVALIYFDAMWCIPCEGYELELSELNYIMKEHRESVKIGKIEAAEASNELNAKYNITGYPTLLLFRNGLMEREYTGRRRAESIYNWLRRILWDGLEPFTHLKPLQDLLSKNSVSTVAFLSEDYKGFEFAMASILYENAVYASVYNEEAAEHFQVTAPAIFSFRGPSVDKMVKFKGDIRNVDEIVNFVRRTSFNRVNKFTLSNASQLVSDGRPLIVLFMGKDAASTRVKASFEEIAQISSEDEYLFVVSGIELPFERRLLSFLGFHPVKFPLVLMLENARGNPKIFECPFALNTFGIASFIEGVKLGTIDRYIRSDPVPWQQEGDIFTIVGQTFKEEVIESEKDVLLNLYTPACSHCKIFHPIYEEVARKMSWKKDLLVAQIDCNANDMQFAGISGYPTLLYYPSGKKKSPIVYKGARSVGAIVNFLKKISAPGVKILDEEL